ncbi:MocR-like pyridoxine biosynthesis transcription factor PdxR [Neobacillus rhizophilus]|uniref:PLP-dependent aminotransferase family protein n=1 Tax=Neobacillus rhizophilus TaxID=2833579 RepID=A0A942TYN0_9BACI|nr:PLP-dependent aminotransferase family protein [Neobacillus rhizophilus]MBS4211210.1 PLP-dependent aminotransferase family protein [Neobacillus rhizophilus]MBU8918734.1 PLP-dependent aminotransferase family protein [Bacillus sp. FJAT-29953]
MLEVMPVLVHKSPTPLYMQLANFIKGEILKGNIKPLEKLPSKRNLANYLGLSLNTVQSAYDQLCAEGFLESRPRSGLFVVELLEDLMVSHDKVEPVGMAEELKEPAEKIDFNSGKVDLEHFPLSVWRRLSVQALYEDQWDLFYTGNPQGERLLREEIAKYLFQSRGVRCTAEQIVIGAGTQVLMGLLCLVIGRDEIYALENPGFHRTRAVLQNLGVLTVPVPLDEEGITVECLHGSGARVVYVTPSHQFPLGMIMPIARRIELLKWAEEMDGYVIEDDYDGEYRYKGKPIPSLQGLDSSERVVYLGTFSKSLIPSLRISYMVLPEGLLARYREHFIIYKQTVSRLHQDTLYRFMHEGHWQTHLNKMRTLYRKKQAFLISAIHNFMGEWVKVIGEKSGLHIVLDVRNGMMEEELVRRAMAAGVKVYPLSVYYAELAGGVDSKVLLGYGGLSENQIQEGIRVLADAWGLTKSETAKG